ncbi:MAG: hypothetical protein US83_C0004G0035 [Candidatus Falkowbacteria bacterium GW2011_GWC2_38_22]|uniref:CxxC-x17-CxxC domain-containing protein n=1 Tax=Candidatus Falkowbacteria bacterium GW2011_GWE1_38_31 TaxID=1618638 RepID=A0A0G0JVG7_9BACT|nr:MAG: hypothetical protein US73_C0002G0082 [Candidatus Falkowbacteria bacterium GW2011_GWF2_38_1205]KKQ61651.1 MAG: hypothetical protein US83_C0004G0035 [Candidatus Falkowbacteria bacterium GW2011_GWC2_38_22]KKQ63734.1 MAG: hypothetical protein US84_C0004G0082 [Candidatus Falkowbacteria bacterium GW2011_GWF1_38_22]KKQ65850.1 MAG: hypothetical protein US87_C0004G0035 [Candidatus Falkowbacteria bacterium GW2011_GWE2_38_254]KKQ70597.1 MAG: hypothetical protein US91_C0004G0082 [Candidatus Falkowb
MGKFNKDDRFGGKKRFDNDRGGGRGDRSDRPAMHHAVCSDCGRDCEVPFRPTGDKPVYCSNCFGNKESSSAGRYEGRQSDRYESRSQDRPRFPEKQMYQAVCDKCHKKCEVPFRPTGDRPVLCSDCFGKNERGGGNNSASPDQYKKQFEILNNKLDAIMKILAPKSEFKKTDATLSKFKIMTAQDESAAMSVKNVVGKVITIDKDETPVEKKTVVNKKEEKKGVSKKKVEKKKDVKKKKK